MFQVGPHKIQVERRNGASSGVSQRSCELLCFLIKHGDRYERQVPVALDGDGWVGRYHAVLAWSATTHTASSSKIQLVTITRQSEGATPQRCTSSHSRGRKHGGSHRRARCSGGVGSSCTVAGSVVRVVDEMRQVRTAAKCQCVILSNLLTSLHAAAAVSAAVTLLASSLHRARHTVSPQPECIRNFPSLVGLSKRPADDSPTGRAFQTRKWFLVATFEHGGDQ